MLAASALLSCCIGMVSAAESGDKSAKAKATQQAKTKPAKKAPSKAGTPSGTVKQKSTQDPVGDIR
jgi:hypothetical protein